MLNVDAHIISKLQQVEVLVLGCSAGGFRVLLNMLEALPANLPIGVLVIVHRNAQYESRLEAHLAAKCRIAIKIAEEKAAIEPATVYFAPAGYHLLVEPDRSLSLDVSEPVHFCRPSIDVTMQSVADVYGASTAAILLSGANQDGALGMQSIHRTGGICIAQHPQHAEIETMPASAIAFGVVDLILKNDELVAFSRLLNHHIYSRN